MSVYLRARIWSPTPDAASLALRERYPGSGRLVLTEVGRGVQGTWFEYCVEVADESPTEAVQGTRSHPRRAGEGAAPGAPGAGEGAAGYDASGVSVAGAQGEGDGW